MKLIDDWRAQLNRLWSIRLALLSALFSALEAGLPPFVDSIPPRLFATLSAVAAVGTILVRLLRQPDGTAKAE